MPKTPQVKNAPSMHPLWQCYVVQLREMVFLFLPRARLDKMWSDSIKILNNG